MGRGRPGSAAAMRTACRLSPTLLSIHDAKCYLKLGSTLVSLMAESEELKSFLMKVKG